MSISAATIFVVGAGIVGVWISSSHSIYQNYRHYLIGLALSASTLVDPALHANIRRPEQQNGPDYRRAVEPLRRLRKAVSDLHYVYTVVRDGEQVRFVLDAADPAAKSFNGVADQAAVWEVYKDLGPAMTAALGNDHEPGVATATDQPTTDSWGTFMTGLAPLHDAEGRQIGAVGVDVDARVYVARLAAARDRALLGLLPAGILIALLGVAFYRVRLRGLTDAHAALTGAEAAKRAAETLADERQRLSAVVEGTNTGTWEWDSAARVMTVSDRAAGKLGCRPEDLQPLTASRWRSLVHPRDLKGVLQALAACAAHTETDFIHEFRMRHVEERWIWVLARGKVMETDLQGRPLRIAGILVDVTARKAMESALAEAALRDNLTGLANRARFMDRLEGAVARVQAGEARQFAVLFLDFDRFKLVNDTLGHKAGDELLRQIAMRLRTALGIPDTTAGDGDDNVIGRFGGDEFLVLINDLNGVGDAQGVAQRLLRSLEPAYGIFDSEVRSTASIGIVTSEQCDGNAEEVVRSADVAMYEAKRAGRACAIVFDAAMHARLSRQVSLENSLRGAIGTAELYLVYQPIVDLSSGRKTAVEALVRWDHPQLGAIAPGEFMPIAEKSGLMPALGDWVLEEACQAMVRWRREDVERAPQTLSVNISRAEIAPGNRLPARLQARLERLGLPAQCLQLEISERDVMRNPDAARDLLREFSGLGVKLAMDDFGTGESSLSQLRGYPFDMVKIDHSFLQGLSSSRDVLAVIHATVNLIENLGMASLAEGLEDLAQIAILQSLGCRYAQGDVLDKPVVASRLLNALEPTMHSRSESAAHV